MSSESKDGSTNIIVESWDPLDPSQPSIHHLPFKIAHTGHANVSKYLILKDKTIAGHQDGTLGESTPIKLSTTAKQASFRGRYIKGTDVTLSEGYSGVVFREEEGDTASRISSLFDGDGEPHDEDGLGDQDTTNARIWTLQNKFSTYIYWTRQSKPTKNDKHAKWLEWTTSIGPAIHAPLTAEDLQKPLKYTDLTKKDETAKEDKTEEAEEVKRAAKRKEPEGSREGDSETTKKATEQEIK